MARTWQQTHNHIVKRAQMLYQEIVNVFTSMTPPDTAKLMYSAKKGEAATRTICRMLRRRIDYDVWAATEAIQVHGMIGPQLHSWFKIEPDAEAKAQEGAERLQPNYKYYVDAQFPEVHPQVLLVSPHSPLLLAYMEQEEVPCLELLKRDRK